MQAFVPAAGLGTRLHPLTDRCPKALVEIHGVPLIKIVIDNLIRQGVTKIVVNVHHFADMVIQYLHDNEWDVPVIISDERSQLLDTGGGLKKAEPLFSKSEPILIHNVDILSHIDFSEILLQHHDFMNIATLAVCHRETSRYLLFNSQQQLVGWKNCKTDEYLWTDYPTDDYHRFAFSGISVIQPQLLKLLPAADHPYSIIPAYLHIARTHRISHYQHRIEDWIDVGKPETLQLAQSWN